MDANCRNSPRDLPTKLLYFFNLNHNRNGTFIEIDLVKKNRCGNLFILLARTFFVCFL